MGLNFRKRTGRIANGSTLIVPGQDYTGIKVFQTTFQNKKRKEEIYQGPIVQESPIPSPSSTPIPTPTPTPTPQIITDSVLVTNNIYLMVNPNEYLKFVDPT